LQYAAISLGPWLDASQLLSSLHSRLSKVLGQAVSEKVLLSSGAFTFRKRSPLQIAASHVNKRLQSSLRMARSNQTIAEKEYGSGRIEPRQGRA
jgi:hypothetical protein